MRFFGLGLSISAFFLCGIASGQTQWQGSFSDALKLAAKTNKPVFVDFYATWCGPCKMLEENVFSDGRVKALLGKTVCLRLDIDQHPDDAQHYSVTSIPRLMLFSPNGRQVLWDTMGYREADEFVQEFSEALHVKAPVALAPPEPVPLMKVRAALGAPGGLGKLDPSVAREGLRMLVAKLGVYKEADFQPPAALLQSAGSAALPELLEGMASKTLAVRVGAFKVVQAILKKGPAFDPWGSKEARAAQLAAWRRTFPAGG